MGSFAITMAMGGLSSGPACLGDANLVVMARSYPLQQARGWPGGRDQGVDPDGAGTAGRRSAMDCVRASALLLALLPVAVSAQDSRTKQVDALFADYAKPQTPGCAVGVMEEGKPVYSRGYGLASLELGVPIDPARTVLDVGSLAKPFTAMSVLLLEQDGKLSLDDSIRKHVFGLPAVFQPVTLRHLLHHTGGAGDYTPELVFGGIGMEDVAGADDVMRLLARRTSLTAPPGTRYEYSNTGYFLLGRAVESVSGKTLPAFVRERIFLPMGMEHSRYFESRTAVIPGRASSYSPDGKGGYALVSSNWEMYGDSSVMSTADDMLLWAAGLHAGTVGGAELTAALQTRGKLNDGTQIKAARSVVIDTYRGRPIAVSTGAWAGFIANQLRFPDDAFAVITLCNRSDSDVDGIGRKVADIYLADRLLPVTTDTSRATGPAPSVIGTYANLQEGAVGTVSAKDDGIWFSDGRFTSGRLAAVGKDRYQIGDTPSRVGFGWDGSTPRSATLFVDDFVVEMVPVKAPSLTTAELSEYAGEYTSHAIDAEAALVVQDGRLAYTGRRVPPIPFAPIAPDAFVGPGDAIIHFSRNASGEVAGFTFAMQRVGRISFDRLKAAP